MERFVGVLGVVVILAIAWGISVKRRAIDAKLVGIGIVLQWVIAAIVLKGDAIAHALSFIPYDARWAGWVVFAVLVTPALVNYARRRYTGSPPIALPGYVLYPTAVVGMLRGNLVGATFDKVRVGVENLMAFSHKGAEFVFGSLASPSGAWGFVFAFNVLPTIIFVASIFAILYYLGVMQVIVGAFARALGKLLKVSGAESVSVAASILMGQTEAPLTIRPFLAKMTRAELMTIMTAGMAHVSGSIMVAYVQIAHVDIVHLLTAVIMTAPGAIMMAKIIVPETEKPETSGDVKVVVPAQDANVIDAAARGGGEGLHLALNVAGMLIAFVALVALLNATVQWTLPPLARAVLPSSTHVPDFNLETLLGWGFRPLAWVMGVPWAEADDVGLLLGKRMVLNEFVAFLDLGQMSSLSAKARLISTFALCGFANFSSIAIQIGGIGALAPERRGDLASLGLRAMIAGTLANFLSACIAGVLG